MKEFILHAKSSSGDSYDVIFRIGENFISVKCSCIAGSLKQLCKHKDAFLNNDAAMLFDDSHSDKLSEIFELVCASNYQKEFDIYQQSITDIERRKKELAIELKQIKGMFGRRLADGL